MERRYIVRVNSISPRGAALQTKDSAIIGMGEFNAQIWKRTNRMETVTGKFWLELRNERGDTLVEWATSRKYNTCSRRKQGGDGRGEPQTV